MKKSLKPSRLPLRKTMGCSKESLEEKLLRKQNKADENRKLVLQSIINKARDSSRLSTESNSESSVKRGTQTNEDEHLKIAQGELKVCYDIITAQKAANFKMLEEMNELKKQMLDI